MFSKCDASKQHLSITNCYQGMTESLEEHLASMNEIEIALYKMRGIVKMPLFL